MTIPKSISISIDLNKIDEQFVTAGKNGARYLDLKLVNTPDNEYGNDYFASQGLPKNVREKVKETGGEYPKTPILGNAKAWQCLDGRANESKGQQQTTQAPQAKSPAPSNDMPF